MTMSLLSLLALAAAGASALSMPGIASPPTGSSALSIRDTSNLTPGCRNSRTSRQCWGKYDINTNYYDTIFHTGRTREYWLTIEETDCAPDGYKRKCMTANGTIPGPAIEADWGDDVIVHVTNKIATNGTAIHWHGVRQLNTNEYDGVPGVSQCPIAPGQSLSYKFHASQYGTSLYHSHFGLQYSMGLYGPLVIKGPATANYDEDLGSVFLTDWDHQTAFEIWATISDFNVTFNGLGTGLINGKNTGNCTATQGQTKDPNCVGDGEKHQLVFEAGKKYRLRLVNIATEAWFQFSIDGHKLTVIANDFVPIVPYETDSVLINMGQRYDVIVEANAAPGDYWLRSGFRTDCIPNGAPDNITAIVRYNKESKATPTTVSTVVPSDNDCMDEPTASLVPWVPIDVTNLNGGINLEDVTGEFVGPYLRWGIRHGSFFWTNWTNPALGDVISQDLAAIPVSDNVFQVGTNSTTAPSQTEWAVLVIDDQTPITGISHPIHLHGHDFFVLGAFFSAWDGTTTGWQYKNPPRRDTALLPPNGHLVIAWPVDNPGVWAVHCHIAWHSSQGFAAAVLESYGLVPGSGATSDWKDVFTPVCDAWNKYVPTAPFQQDDSGI